MINNWNNQYSVLKLVFYLKQKYKQQQLDFLKYVLLVIFIQIGKNLEFYDRVKIKLKCFKFVIVIIGLQLINYKYLISIFENIVSFFQMIPLVVQNQSSLSRINIHNNPHTYVHKQLNDLTQSSLINWQESLLSHQKIIKRESMMKNQIQTSQTLQLLEQSKKEPRKQQEQNLLKTSTNKKNSLGSNRLQFIQQKFQQKNLIIHAKNEEIQKLNQALLVKDKKIKQLMVYIKSLMDQKIIVDQKINKNQYQIQQNSTNQLNLSTSSFISSKFIRKNKQSMDNSNKNSTDFDQMNQSYYLKKQNRNNDQFQLSHLQKSYEHEIQCIHQYHRKQIEELKYQFKVVEKNLREVIHSKQSQIEKLRLKNLYQQSNSIQKYLAKTRSADKIIKSDLLVIQDQKLQVPKKNIVFQCSCWCKCKNRLETQIQMKKNQIEKKLQKRKKITTTIESNQMKVFKPHKHKTMKPSEISRNKSNSTMLLTKNR